MADVGWERALRRRLATPRGQLELFGATFVVAVVIAMVAATQRPFFEGYVREKYPTPTAATEKLAASLAMQGDALRSRSEAERTGLYQAFMQGDGYEAVPRALAEADPEGTARRLVRTWHAGSDAQRRRALAFVAAAQSPALLDAIERAALRSRPASTELSQALQDARDALSSPGQS